MIQISQIKFDIYSIFYIYCMDAALSFFGNFSDTYGFGGLVSKPTVP